MNEVSNLRTPQRDLAWALVRAPEVAGKAQRHSACLEPLEWTAETAAAVGEDSGVDLDRQMCASILEVILNR